MSLSSLTPFIAQAGSSAFTWRPLAPELLILAAVLILPLLGLGMKGTTGKRDMGRITVLVLLGALVMVAIMIWRGTYLGTEIQIAHDAALYEVTAFSQFLKLIFLGVGILIALASIEYAAEFHNPIEYYTLLLTAIVGMMVVASARDLITLFIGIETASLSSYILAGYAKDNKFSVEAATKYFVIGALSGASFLYGISLVYGITGTLHFDAMSTAASNAFGMEPVSLVAVTLILVGIGFKISAAPFHMWAPDVYHGAPDTVSGFLSAGSKAMGFAAAFKILVVGLAAYKAEWEVLVGLIAVASMFVGNLIALRQTSMKRLLAYSSIAHAGYILIAVVVGTQYAVAGGLFHLVTNALMKGAAFIAIAGIAAYGLGDNLNDWKGMRLRNPLLAFTLTIVLLSLAGVPPFGGFASKFVLFSSAVYASFDGGASWLIWLAIAGIINSLISVFYYAKIIRYMYAESGDKTDRLHLSTGTTVALLIALVLIIGVGVWPDLILGQAMDAATSLVAP